MFFYYLFLIFSIHLYVSPLQRFAQKGKTIFNGLTHHAQEMIPTRFKVPGLTQPLQRNFSSQNLDQNNETNFQEFLKENYRQINFNEKYSENELNKIENLFKPPSQEIQKQLETLEKEIKNMKDKDISYDKDNPLEKQLQTLYSQYLQEINFKNYLKDNYNQRADQKEIDGKVAQYMLSDKYHHLAYEIIELKKKKLYELSQQYKNQFNDIEKTSNQIEQLTKQEIDEYIKNLNELKNKIIKNSDIFEQQGYLKKDGFNEIYSFLVYPHESIVIKDRYYDETIGRVDDPRRTDYTFWISYGKDTNEIITDINKNIKEAIIIKNKKPTLKNEQFDLNQIAHNNNSMKSFNNIEFSIYLKQYMAEIEKSYAKLFGHLLSDYVYPSEEMKNILNCERNNTQNVPINFSNRSKIEKEFAQAINNTIKGHLNLFPFENKNKDLNDLLEELNSLEKKDNINPLQHILHFLMSSNTTNRVENLYLEYNKKTKEQRYKNIEKEKKAQKEQERKVFLQKVGGGVVAAIVIVGGILYLVKGKNKKEVEKKTKELDSNQGNQIKTETNNVLNIELNEEQIQQLKKTILEKIDSNHIQNQENVQSAMTNFYLEKIRPHLNKDQLSLDNPQNDGIELRKMIQATDQFKNIAEQLTQQLDDKNKIEEAQNNQTKELSQDSNKEKSNEPSQNNNNQKENQNKQSQDSNQETSKQQTKNNNQQQLPPSEKSSLPIPSKSIFNSTSKKALAGVVGLTLLGLGIKKGYDYYKKKKQKHKSRHSQQNSSNNKIYEIVEKNK